MTALLPAVAGALVVAGLIGLVVGLRKAPPRPPAPPRSHPALARLTADERTDPVRCCWPGSPPGWWWQR